MLHDRVGKKLINAAQEIIFTACLNGNDLVQFGREVAQILFDYWLLEKEPYEILTGKV
ncbi:hypothetical protein [Thermoanaerobacterium sp. DL9XJH110]|uniref:hypothetical protein n=1 Tax=Thermoanaerobacterium sp. DL9XJH110 TaxID=3386643 RepID=UPI0001B0FC7A